METESLKMEKQSHVKVRLHPGHEKAINGIVKRLHKLLGNCTRAYYVYSDDGSSASPAKEQDWYTTKSGEKGYKEKYIPLTEDAWQWHIRQEETIGVLFHDENDDCTFFVIDVDYHEGKDSIEKKELTFSTTLRIINHLFKLGFHPICEESGSRNSYHIIVAGFPKTPGVIVRNFLYHMLEIELGIPIKEGKHNRLKHGVPVLADDDMNLRGVEIFPKQDKASVTPKGLGNQIKAPLGLHRKTGRMSKFWYLSTFEAPYDIDNFKPEYLWFSWIPNFLDIVVMVNEVRKIPIVELPKIEIKKQPVEDDKTFKHYLKKQDFLIQFLYYTHDKILIPKLLKRFIARNFHIDGTPERKILKFYMGQIDYNETLAIEGIRETLEDLITEIYESKVKDENDDSLTGDVEEDRETIRKEIKVGKHKRWKVGCEDKFIDGKKIKGLKSAGGDLLKKKICDVTCQMRKNVFNSLVKGGNYDKARKSLFMPLFKQIWEIIDVGANRTQLKGHTYVHISPEELQKIVNEIPGIYIKDIETKLMPDLEQMNFIETKKNGQRTFESRNYEGRKYRFNKDTIDKVLN